MSYQEMIGSQLSKAIDDKRKLEDLRSNPAFLYLNEIVQMQVDQLQKDILYSPCTSVDSTLAQEYKKGQLEGRVSWGGVLDSQIASLAFDIQTLQEQLEHDDFDGTAAANSAP